MKSKTLFLLGFFAILLGTPVFSQEVTPGSTLSDQEPPLRLSEPSETLISDLESYIPEYMRQEDIPGVAIALIREGEIVWSEGFGVKNKISTEQVTPETLFEVASNSKVVTSYIGLRLVDQGVLSLDEPMNAFLPEPWLPPSEYRDIITLRHVLSHSSGLGHSTPSRENLFAPGSGYSYSSKGFEYLQAVIEQVTGASLEDVARKMVFAPLGMSSSSFINRPEFTQRTANGHLRAGLPALIFAIFFGLCLVVIGLIGLLILRIWRGHWQPSRWMVIGILAVALVLSLGSLFTLLGSSNLLEFAWLIALYGLTMSVAIVLVTLAGRVFVVRYFSERLWLQKGVSILWSLLILVGVIWLTSRLTNLPVPKWPPVRADAAESMRATVGDMATFLIEISDPIHLSAEVAQQLQTSQVKLSDDLSWGLGPGIQHSQQGDALWHWGQHIDFQSVMIIYPEHGFGVVVCTNNDWFNPDVAVEIAHRALGGKIEPIRRAIRLEYDYRE